MRIALVFPPFYLEGLYNLPPLGLINLATSLGGQGHEIELLDLVLALRQKVLPFGPGIYDACVERILTHDPEVVALSTQCTTFPPTLQMARRIKARRPDVKIVLGGHNVSFVDERVLMGYPFVDAVVRGEGEITFRELMASYARGGQGEEVPGVTLKQEGQVVRNEDRPLLANLDALPFPDYGFAPPLSAYRQACGLSRNIAILEVGRGCPHRCIYCSESILWRRRARTYSVDRVVGEMIQLRDRFDAQCFVLAYDQFTARRTFVEAFCRQVLEKGLQSLSWYCISRLDSVDPDLLSLMRRAGCESMCYGIDSGSRKTLAFIRKDIDEAILYQRVRETAEQGMIPTLSFVIGFPEEDKADLDQTLIMALRTGIVGNSNPLIQMPTSLPGTDLYHRYLDRLIRKVDTYFGLGIEFDRDRRLSEDEEMIHQDPAVFSSFYNLPCPARPPEELSLISTFFPLVVRLFPKAFLLLALTLKASVSDLFLEWLSWLQDRLQKPQPSVTPGECYRYLRPFFEHKRGGQGPPHLWDLLQYEECAIAVAEHPIPSTPRPLEGRPVEEVRLKTYPGILVQEFERGIPDIIQDFKAGMFEEVYPPAKTLLLFRQVNDVLETVEINPFMRDFLDLCDGKTPLATIARQLRASHGQDMTAEAFFSSCAEAALVLATEGYVEEAGQAVDSVRLPDQGEAP